MSFPSVFIIVVNWNGRHLLTDCLNSLQTVISPDFSILVVDNGSSDGSVDFIRDNYPEVKILSLEKNIGFARGNNTGFNFAKQFNPDYVIFLNNDTVVDENFIEPLITEMENSPEIGQTCPKIYFHGTDKLIWYAGGIVNLWTGSVYHPDIRKTSSYHNENPRSTGYATGCCVGMRSSDFTELGGFNENYQMYAEDVDLSLRLKKLGKRVYYIPQSIIWHKVSSSIGGQFSLVKAVRKLRGLLRLLKDHASTIQKLTAVIWLCFFQIPFQVVKFICLKQQNKCNKSNKAGIG